MPFYKDLNKIERNNLIQAILYTRDKYMHR